MSTALIYAYSKRIPSIIVVESKVKPSNFICFLVYFCSY